MHEDLSKKHCEPCQKGSFPFTVTKIRQMLNSVPGWHLSVDGKAIERQWQFKDFSKALVFVNRVAGVAESENHHPDIALGWGYARISLTTHHIGGLHENDFIVAAKINALI